MRVLALVSLLWPLSLLPQQAVEHFEGRPVFAEGVDLGYYIWHDEDGWQIRWTTKGVMRRFTGTVISEGGELKSLKRIDVETERRVLYPGRRARVVVGPQGSGPRGTGSRPRGGQQGSGQDRKSGRSHDCLLGGDQRRHRRLSFSSGRQGPDPPILPRDRRDPATAARRRREGELEARQASSCGADSIVCAPQR